MYMIKNIILRQFDYVRFIYKNKLDQTINIHLSYNHSYFSDAFRNDESYLYNTV